MKIKTKKRKMHSAATNKKETNENQLKRRCPGEKYEITKPVCSARQSNRYPKCLLCSFYDGSPDDYSSGDPKIKKSIFRSGFIAGQVPEEINEYVMRKLGSAAGQFLRARNNGKGPIAVACDRRENSRNLSRIFGEGLESAGMHAVHLGPSMPDMLRFAMKKHGMGAGAFISGCNARFEVNGLRIITSDGRPVHYERGLEKIGLIARRMKAGRSQAHGKNDTIRVLPDYRSYMVEQAPELARLKVVIDGSAGIAGEVMPSVLAKTPLKVIKSHCEADGRSEFLGLRFPAGEVNTSIQQAVRSNDAHLGMAIDYDGDLCAFYDEEGRVLREDVAAALIAGELLALKPGCRIAYDLRSTAALREDILRGGGQALRTSPAAGSVHEAIIARGAEYGFTISGRHMFRAFSGGESPLMALLLLCSAATRHQKPVSRLAEKVRRYAYSGIITHEMPSPEKAAAAVSAIETEFEESERDELDGVTFRFPTWWFHLKHDSDSRIIRSCIEGRTAEEERTGRNALEEIIRRYQNRR